MNKKSLLSLLPLTIAAITTSFGNVGESEAGIESRYGKTFGQIPTNTFGIVTGFIAAGYVVGVKFVDGVSEMEMFCKGDQSEMPASEIDRLLKRNSPGDWKAELTGKPTWRRWRRDDGSAVALYDTTRHFLYVNSKNFYEVKGQQMEEQQWSAGGQPQSANPGTGTAIIPAVTASPAASASP